MRSTHWLGVSGICIGAVFARPAAAQAPQPTTPVVDPGPPAGAPPTAPPPVVIDPPPPVVTETAPPPVVTASPSQPSPDDAATAPTTLRVFAEQERSARVAGGVAGLAFGAGLVAGGLVADLEFEKSYGTPVWAVGIGVMVGSTIGMFVHGPMESLAATHATAPPDALRRIWADEAARARSARHIGGAISIGLGAVAAGAGVAIAAGAGDLDQDEKEGWSLGLLLGGAGMLGGGIAALLMETHIEQGYRAAYGLLAPAPITVGVAPAPGGASFAVSGRF